MAKRKSAKPRSFKAQIFLIVGIITAAVFLPTTALLAVGMLPTGAAFLVDRTRKKSTMVTVGAMNLAGCTPFLLELWHESYSFEKSVSLVLNPYVLFVMYSAAAMGWLIDWAVAGLVASLLYQRGLARQRAIQERQKQLVERWGEEVTGSIPLDAGGFPLKSR